MPIALTPPPPPLATDEDAERPPPPPPPPPTSAAAEARTRQTNGCLTTFIMGSVMVVSVLAITYYRYEKTKSVPYMVTDKAGRSEAFNYPWFDQHVGVLVFVGLPCLVALAVAIYRDRRHLGARTACIAVLVFSAIAVAGGTVMLRSQPTPITCEACLNPDWFSGSCESMNGPMSSSVHLDPVPCPASYQEGALQVVKALDRQSGALIVVGGICALAGIVLLFRSLLRRSKSLPAGVPPHPPGP